MCGRCFRGWTSSGYEMKKFIIRYNVSHNPSEYEYIWLDKDKKLT